MKKRLLTKLMAFLLIFVMAIPMVSIRKPETVYAASASMNTTWKTIYMGSTYTFWVKNAANVKTKTWSSSNKSVATVNGKGLVTPIKAGSATISCKIIFTNGTSQTVKATVAVKNRVPAKTVTVSADLGTINAHTLKVGESHKFKFTKTPSNTTDYAYFTIADEEYASVTSAGVVTAKKPGITMLEVACGPSEAAAKSLTNTVKTRVYLYITGDETVTPSVTPTPTPTPGATNPKVNSVSLASSKELKIDFSSAILSSSVIDSNGNLISGSVTIGLTPGANNFNNIAPSLSKDKKSLILTASANFEGTYVITISESILSETGVPVTPYTVQKTLKDDIGPSYVTTTIDETGYVANIEFSEPIDISELSIYNVVGTNNTTLQAYLTNANNYILSADRKSLSIDLSACGVTKANTLVYVVGIKDIIGNVSNPFTLPVVVEIDATVKPNASLVSVVRTSKNLVTATFSRPIQYAGYMYIGNDYVSGIVDSADSTKVNYAIPNTSLTGSQIVTLNGWFSYNSTGAQSSDVKRSVDFTLDNNSPLLVSSVLTTTTENNVPVTKLTLTYNKEVSLISGNGKLSTKIVSSNANIYNKELSYTAVAKGMKVTLSFINQATEMGTYYFSLPAGLVIDKYENASVASTITATKQTSSSSVLPAPVSIAQDITNPSKIYIKFNQKLDMASVANTSNYIIGTTTRPSSANVIAQDENSATIELVFANNAIGANANYPVTVKGIKGFNDSYAEMETYNTILPLVENCAPTFLSAKLTSSHDINVSFSEYFTGTVNVTVYNGNSTVGSSYYVGGKEMYISLDQPITGTAYIMFTNNELVDDNNNKANLIVNKKIAVSRAY